GLLQMGGVCSSATDKSTKPPVVSTLSELLSKQLISVLEENRAFHCYLEKLGIPHEYEEFPGAHVGLLGSTRAGSAHLPPACPGIDGVRVKAGCRETTFARRDKSQLGAPLLHLFASVSRPERDTGSHARRSPSPGDTRHVGWEGLHGPQGRELDGE